MKNETRLQRRAREFRQREAAAAALDTVLNLRAEMGMTVIHICNKATGMLVYGPAELIRPFSKQLGIRLGRAFRTYQSIGTGHAGNRYFIVK